MADTKEMAHHKEMARHKEMGIQAQVQDTRMIRPVDHPWEDLGEDVRALLQSLIS